MTQTENLARKFSEFLAEEIGQAKLAEVIRRNALSEYKGCCASHDYCDANVVMADAFEKIFDRPVLLPGDVEGDSELEKQHEEENKLWNESWDLAKRNNFYIN